MLRPRRSWKSAKPRRAAALSVPSSASRRSWKRPTASENAMTPADSPRPTIEQLTEAFLERYRQGQRPSPSEYANRYPELADEIREVFAALVLVEEAGRQPEAQAAAYAG